MTKARDLSKLLGTNTNGVIPSGNLDVDFENIVDTGTEGTKVATGTTAQRGSTTGQIRFNSTTGLAEYYTGTSFKSIDAPPTVSSIDVTEVDSQAGGNQTIVITGSGFNSGATVTFVGNSGTDFNASTVTVDSNTQITAVAPKASFLNAQEPYGVKVINTSGLSAILASQINVDSSPSWSTASGTLATINDDATGTHATVSATDPDGDTIVYSETTSVLSGAGFSLNSSTGAITGDPTDVSSATTKTFTIRATAGSKTADREFNIVINPAPISAYYLMVAGGGAGGAGSATGGYGGGGGGAGGYKTNYGGSPIAFTSGTVYPIIVGSGGTYTNYNTSSTSSNDGGNSTFFGYTVNGGGAGGTGNDAGRTGGSAGGHGGNTSGYTNNTNADGVGNRGGASSGNGSPYSGGGGGGAGGAGTQASSSTYGEGGSGVQNAITGSNLWYAAGGGGSTWSDGYSGTTGWNQKNGIGGRGAARYNSGTGIVGTNGTGSGGGAGGSQSNMGGNGNSYAGGSGVVILRLPTSSYSGTTSGSPTVTTDGSDTVIKFTGNGSYTA